MANTKTNSAIAPLWSVISAFHDQLGGGLEADESIQGHIDRLDAFMSCGWGDELVRITNGDKALAISFVDPDLARSAARLIRERDLNAGFESLAADNSQGALIA